MIDPAAPQKLTPPSGHGYIVRAAAGSEPANLTFFTHPRGAASSFHDKTYPGSDKPNEQVVVPVVRVDDFIDSPVFLLAIDTQGHEPHVLKGASKLFAKGHIETLSFEVYARGLLNGNVDFEKDVLDYLWNDLDFFCSTARAPIDSSPFPTDHPSSFAGFSEMVKNFGEKSIENNWFGRWDDMVCHPRHGKL